METYQEDLIAISKARFVFSKSLKMRPVTETLMILEALGRVAGRRITADENNPRFARSAMDGYAVRAHDLLSATSVTPVILDNIASITIGVEQQQHAGPETCVWIPTGGIVPSYYDSVVQVELTIEENSRVKFFNSVRTGSNIDPVGFYHQKGDILLSEGTKISSREIAILTELGIQEIEVIRKPRIGIVSTGNELIPQGAQKHSDKVYDSNGHAIKSLLEETGYFTTKYYGIIRDDEGEISSKLKQMVAENDLVVTTGGTSKGDKDFLPRVLSNLSPGIQFQGMNVKPGKPTIFALSGKVPIIALPGPPVSSYLVMFDIFLPIILSKLGIRSFSPPVRALLSEDVRVSEGKYNIVPVSLVQGDELKVNPLQGSSAAISRLSMANGYFTYEGDLKLLTQGTEVMVKPFTTSVF